MNEHIVRKQVELLREYYNLGVYPDNINALCGECDLENYLFSLRNNIYYEQVLLYKLGIDEPYHRASLLGFPNGGEVQWFLVDPTYGQFLKNKKFNDYMTKNYKDFTFELLKNGYVECTLEYLYSYIHGFMFSNAFSDNIDSKVVYKNLYDLIISMKQINDYEEAREKETRNIKKRKSLFNRKKKSK